jgi:hypothetical protein
MKKVTHESHPDYVKMLTGQGASRPARVEIKARGKNFAAEKRYPRGVRTPDPTTYMTNEELFAKFRNNALGVLDPEHTEQVIDEVMGLEKLADVSTFIRKTVRTADPDKSAAKVAERAWARP